MRHVIPLVRGRETIENDHAHVHFDSLRDMVEQCARTQHVATLGTLSRDPASAWTQHATFDEAVHLATHGWPEGLHQAQQLMLGLDTPRHRATTLDEHVHVVGSRVHMPSYLHGSPRCMLRTNDDVPGEIVTLVVSTTFLCNVRASTVMNRGVAIAACVDELERGGERVHVVADLTVHAGHDRLTVRTVLKNASDPLDLGTLVFAVAHAAYLRRLGFALIEQYAGSAWDEALRNGYGRSASAIVHDPDHVSFPCVQGNPAQWDTPTSALDHLRVQIPQLAIELEGESS